MDDLIVTNCETGAEIAIKPQAFEAEMVLGSVLMDSTDDSEEVLRNILVRLTQEAITMTDR